MESNTNIIEEIPTATDNMLTNELTEGSIFTRSPIDLLEERSTRFKSDILSNEFACLMDKEDSLAEARTKFDYPLKKNMKFIEKSTDYNPEEKECIYLCGNSLGLKPKSTNQGVIEQLEKWGKIAVEMHFDDPLPAALCDRYGRESLGRLIGADPSCVSLMSGLTINLHLLLVSFYQPTKDRFKILIESHAFPSDRYVVKSQAAVRGYDPKEAVIEVAPREGENLLRTEDIIQTIEKEGSSIAVVCLSGVQYYTGQKFDMEKITKAGQKKGCLVGWDLAHAIGNVHLCMDKWNVDFACWCTYKYLNSGPGAIAGAYINKRHNRRQAPHFLGWWSNTEATRFNMLDDCDVAEGIDSFRLTNPSPFLVSCVLSGLELFDEYGMNEILKKQHLLTGYLELLLDRLILKSKDDQCLAEIITPRDPHQRGSQISLQFNFELGKIHDELKKRGVMCDVRQPSAMRLAPVPLYNSYLDVYKFVHVLQEVIMAHQAK